jgi:hypothetical protein
MEDVDHPQKVFEVHGLGSGGLARGRDTDRLNERKRTDARFSRSSAARLRPSVVGVKGGGVCYI